MLDDFYYLWDKTKDIVKNGYVWFMEWIAPMPPVGKAIVGVATLMIGLIILHALVKILLWLGIILSVTIGTGFCVYLISKSLKNKEDKV